jgi:hypothetical protein
VNSNDRSLADASDVKRSYATASIVSADRIVFNSQAIAS